MLTIKERDEKLKDKTNPELARYRTIANWYFAFAIAMVIYFAVTLFVVQSDQATYIGDMIYGTVLLSRVVYFPESLWLYRRTTRAEYFWIGLFYFLGITGLLLLR